MGRRIGFDMAAAKDPAQIAFLQERQVQRDLRDARRKTHDQIASTPSNAVQRGFGIVAADRVSDAIGPLTFAGRLELRRQRLLRITVQRPAWIDQTLIRPQRLGRGQFFV